MKYEDTAIVSRSILRKTVSAMAGAMCKTVDTVLPEDATQVKMQLNAERLECGSYAVGYVIDIPDAQQTMFN